MLRNSTELLVVGVITLNLGIACESDKKESTTSQVERALSARVPPPEPPPAPAQAAPSAEPEKPIEAPEWVNEYATALCKRVAVCREKMLAAVPPQQKMMLSMQIPTQEACFENTTTFKEKAPKAELDSGERKALENCLRSVPSMACGNVQTGKVPECQTIADLIAAAKGPPGGQGGAPMQ